MSKYKNVLSPQKMKHSRTLDDLDLPDKKDTCYICRKPKIAFWHEPGCHPEVVPSPHKFVSITTNAKRERRMAETQALAGCPDPLAFVEAVRTLIRSLEDVDGTGVYDGQAIFDLAWVMDKDKS